MTLFKLSRFRCDRHRNMATKAETLRMLSAANNTKFNIDMAFCSCREPIVLPIADPPSVLLIILEPINTYRILLVLFEWALITKCSFLLTYVIGLSAGSCLSCNSVTQHWRVILFALSHKSASVHKFKYRKSCQPVFTVGCNHSKYIGV